MATFDSEFKEQRRKRLEEDYNRLVVRFSCTFLLLMKFSDLAAATPNGDSTSPASNVIMRQAEKLPFSETKDDAKPPEFSSLFGSWAWKRGRNAEPIMGTESQASQTHSSPNGVNGKT